MTDDFLPKLAWSEPWRGVFRRGRDRWPECHRELMRICGRSVMVAVPICALIVWSCYRFIPHFVVPAGVFFAVAVFPLFIYGMLWLEIHFAGAGMKLYRGRVWCLSHKGSHEIAPGNLHSYSLQESAHGEVLCLAFLHTRVRGGPAEVTRCFLLADGVDRNDLLARLETFCPSGRVEWIEPPEWRFRREARSDSRDYDPCP